MKKALFIGIMAAIFMIANGLPTAQADDQSDTYYPKYVIDQGGQDCGGKTPEECIKIRADREREASSHRHVAPTKKPYVVTSPCDKYPCLREINGRLVEIKEDTTATRASVGDVDPKDPPDERTVQQKTRKNLAETREVSKNLGKSKSGKSLHENHGDSLKGETSMGMLRDIHGALIPNSPFKNPNGYIVPEQQSAPQSGAPGGVINPATPNGKAIRDAYEKQKKGKSAATKSGKADPPNDPPAKKGWSWSNIDWNTPGTWMIIALIIVLVAGLIYWLRNSGSKGATIGKAR